MQMESRNYYKTTLGIESFIKKTVDDAGAKGVVFGLSGGIDSAVTAFLCAKAFPENCLAMIMPNLDFTPSSETDDGIMVAKILGIRHEIFPIKRISDAYIPQDEHLVRGNLNARIRANILYMRAAQNNYLVCGTSDRSEFEIGYFTKYGDSACDLAPIMHLYKTQIRQIAQFLGVPLKIIKKKSSAHLYTGHSAETELGMSYDEIDRLLKSNLGVFGKTDHKRSLPRHL